jgi:hypothetical protein
LRANCSLRRTIDLVTITLVVQNSTGGDIRGLTGGQMSLDPEGGALFFDRAGPIPTTYSLVRNGFSVSFQWSGRLTPNGTMGFSALAGGIGPDNRQVNTQLADCGTATADGGDFNPAGFVASCGIAQDGRVTVNVANHSGATLSNVTPVLKATNATGGAQVSNLTGPVPGSTRRLPDGQNASYAWRARFNGHGQIAMQFEVSGLRPNEARASSGLVNCEIRLQGSASNLPDIGVDSEALRRSVRVTTENFGRGHCAFVEGCLGGTGARRLLRFSTMTPNYGPGDQRRVGGRLPQRLGLPVGRHHGCSGRPLCPRGERQSGAGHRGRELHEQQRPDRSFHPEAMTRAKKQCPDVLVEETA